MPQQPKRATIRDVAEATGLSPAAVSYALRGIQTSEETQERVRRAAAELGYKVDRIARALASGRTGTVGLLFGSLEDLWQQLLGVGIGSALLARDHYALLVDAAGDPERELLLAAKLGCVVHVIAAIHDARRSPLHVLTGELRVQRFVNEHRLPRRPAAGGRRTDRVASSSQASPGCRPPTPRCPVTSPDRRGPTSRAARPDGGR